MAYTANEQFQSANGKGSALRCFPGYDGSIQPKTFASGSGTLAALTPVAFNTSTSKWVPYASGGANGTGTISGFVWPDAVVLDGTNDVLGNVILGGRIHLDDIPIISGYTLAQLKTSLLSDARSRGFIIEGLANFR